MKNSKNNNNQLENLKTPNFNIVDIKSCFLFLYEISPKQGFLNKMAEK